MLRYLTITTCILLGACHSEIYVRDGVTDGDTFYLSHEAMYDPDPALQSWVAYSLMKSTCQLEIAARPSPNVRNSTSLASTAGPNNSASRPATALRFRSIWKNRSRAWI